MIYPTTTPHTTPPHDEAAEMGLLGAILHDDARCLPVANEGGIAPQSFYVPANRDIYRAIMSLNEGGRGVDMLTVQSRLKEMGKLDSVGGTMYVARVYESCDTPAYCEHYAAIVHAHARRRQVIQAARTAEADALDCGDDVDGCVDRAEAAFLEIGEDRTARAATITLSESMSITMRHIEQVMEHGVYPGAVLTGYKALDTKLLGLRPGHLVLIAARPSMGKTSLAMNIVERVIMGENGQEPIAAGVFSLEMPHEELSTRMLCSRSEVNGRAVQGGFLTEAHRQKLVDAQLALRKARLYVDDTGGLDVAQLRSRARRMVSRWGVGLIVVDYLQLLHFRAARSGGDGRQVEVSGISGSLKAMAKELHLPVLALSQLSRNPDQRTGEGGNRPRLSDLRDSGALEQDADVVCFLYRPCMYDRDCEDKRLVVVDVAKNRGGQRGEINMDFEEEYTRFRDRAAGVDFEGDEA